MKLPAVAVKLAVLLPAATTTVAGTVSAPVLLDRDTVTPTVFDTVAVQVELPPGPRIAGVQLSALTAACAVSAMLAVCVLPLRLAVTTAV